MLQMLVRANGRHQIAFETLLVGKEADWKAKDATRLAAMKHNYQSSLEAVVKSIVAGASSCAPLRSGLLPRDRPVGEILQV